MQQDSHGMDTSDRRQSKNSEAHTRTRRLYAHKLHKRRLAKKWRRKNKILRYIEDLRKLTLKWSPSEAITPHDPPEKTIENVPTWRSISTIAGESKPEVEQDSHWAAVSENSPMTHDARTMEDGLLLRIPVRINGHTMTALIDSGASRSYIKQECVAPLNLEFSSSVTYLELADGTKIMSQGRCDGVHLYTGSVLTKLSLTVTKLLADVQLILGANWLETVNPMID